MVRNWLEPQKITVPEAFYNAVGGHPLVAETMIRRGFGEPKEAKSFLNPDYYSPAQSDELPGIKQAIDRITYAIDHKERICVWGDFDVDGQTATTILVSTLRFLGADPIYHIPIRAEESHGVNQTKLKDYLSLGIKVLLTCDTGISSHHAIDYAQSSGTDVIITDHHELPNQLPTAKAIVNPKLLEADHPLATLPGVGVAYKFTEGLLQSRGLLGEVDRYLDLVALGIVADGALQIGYTRYLLQLGLSKLQNTTRLGLKAMMELTDLNPSRITEEHIGYVLAPRLNALGRLSDANLGVELLTTEDHGKAKILASRLEGLNAKRKLLTDQVYQAALSQIQREPFIRNQPILILSHPSWPAGVIGIVASRLVERFRKPTILFSTPPDKLARGSARSVEGLDITAAIGKQEKLINEYGGHPMAAGLTITPESLPEFSKSLIHAVKDMLADNPITNDLKIDRYLPLNNITKELVAEIERLAPFGAGNPALVFASPDLNLKERKPIGRHDEHILLTVKDQSGNLFDVIWWQGGGRKFPKGKFDLAYKVRTSDYRGDERIQFVYVDARVVELPSPTVKTEKKLVKVVDYRNEQNPISILRRWRSKEKIQVWCEAQDVNVINGSDRFHLTRDETLVIWTIPPSNKILHNCLEKVSPHQVVLFANDPGLDQMEPFLQRLAGLIKYSMRTQNIRIDLESLSAAMAHQITTIKLGLAWMEESGYIQIVQTGDQIILKEGENKTGSKVSETTALLNMMLDETAAYREYYTRCDKDHLMNYL